MSCKVELSPNALETEANIRGPIDTLPPPKSAGRVFIIPERCKECKYCWQYCPEKILEPSQALNDHGHHYPQIKPGKESACIACGICEWICPDFAIYAVKERTTSGIASRIRSIRWASQLGFLAAFLFLTTGAVCTVFLGRGIAFSEPFGVLQLISGQILKPNVSFTFITTSIIVGVAGFVVITILIGRAFCAWACPIGTLIDAFDTVLEKLKFTPFFARTSDFSEPTGPSALVRNGMNKYAVLGSALASSALLGTPVWCAFCPIGSICRGAIAGPELAVGAEILSVPAVGAMSLGEKRFWCKYLCPVGGFLTILSRYNIFIKPRMRDARHRNCGLCEKICPEGINLCQEQSYSKCTKCLECYAKCPAGAVSVKLT